MPPRTTRRTAAAAAAAVVAAAAAAAATAEVALDMDMESGGEDEARDVNQGEDEDEAEVSGGEESESVSHAAYTSYTNVHLLIRQKKKKRKKTVQQSNLPHRLSQRSKLPWSFHQVILLDQTIDLALLPQMNSTI